MKRILCALLLVCLLCALTPPALADGQVQKVSLHIPCTVTVDVGEHGKVYTNGTTYTGRAVGSFKVTPGTRVAFLITPDTGYVVSVLTLSGADVRPQLRYGLYSVVVNRDETLLVRFSTDPGPSPSPSPSPTPSVSPTPTASPTPTPSASPTPTTSPTPTPTVTPYPWPTPTAYPWPTPTPYPWTVTPPKSPKTGDTGATLPPALPTLAALALTAIAAISKKRR